MWQNKRKDSAIVSLALLLALATTPMAAPLFVSTPVLAQSATNSPAFPLPETVAEGTTVRIDGSMNLAAINQSLRRGFENQFSGTNVEVAANGTDVALQGLLDGSVDIVAMARGLTPQEQAQGLEQVVIHREKIAIIVGAENPFQGSLTDTQFARIFRGRITDWSQLGAPAAPIRFIDRPETSDTRNTLRTYPDFKVARFATGANATQIDEDNTAKIVAQLGNDGISYAMAHHVSQQPSVRVIPLNNTLPDDPKYLFSQPLVYAYRQNPTPQVASFLGFTLAAPGQTAIAEGRTAEAEAIAKGESQALFLADPTPVEEPVAQQPVETTPIPTEQIPLWWLLLPTAVIAGLLAWIFRSRLWATEASNQPEALPENQAPIVTDNTIVSPPVNKPIGETISHNGAGTGSAIAASVTDTSTDDKVISENITSSNYTEIDSYDLSESPWDIEAPAAVVNTSYPQMSDVPKVTPQPDVPVPAEEPNIAVPGNLTPEQDQSVLNETAVAGGVTAGGSVVSQMENGHDTTESSNSPEIVPEVQPPINENNNSLPTFSDIPEDKLNVVADEAEPMEMPEETEDLATGVVNEPLLEVDGERNLTLQPRNAQWAYATWHISETCQQSLQTRGFSQLALRLYDVTDLDLSNQTPVFIQHYELEPGAVEIYVAIPQSGRDYIAEVGYVTPDERWVTITRSPRVRVLDTPPTDTTDELFLNVNDESSLQLKPRNAEWAYATWFIGEASQQVLQSYGISQLALRLYDVTDLDLSYQTPVFIQHYELEPGAVEIYVAIPQSERDYIAEIGYMTSGDRWATITRSPRVRVFNLPVTDTTDELLPDVNDGSSLQLKPRNPEWAYATWFIGEASQQALQTHGISQLALRLYDVTDIDLSYQTPESIKQYELEPGAVEIYVEIPQSERDYIAEIGYVTSGDRWVIIARSPRVRVFGLSVTDATDEPLPEVEGERNIILQPRNAQWAYVTWYIAEIWQHALQASGISELALRLYDVTDIDLSYQTPESIKQYELEPGAVEIYVEIPQSERDYIAEIGYITSGDRWVTIARSPRARVFGLSVTDTIDEPPLEVDGERNITIQPRNAQWADVTWSISETCQQAIQSRGVTQLALRLYDVTDLDLSYQTPEFIQHYELQPGVEAHEVEIPQSERDYMAEVGYLTEDERWVTITRSQRVRIFNLPVTNNIDETTPTADETFVELSPTNNESHIIFKSRTAKWAYTTWYISETHKQVLRDAGISQLSLRLYDVTDIDLSYQTPQLLQQYECEGITSDRYVAIPTSERDYMTEIGYIKPGEHWETIARSKRVRVFSRPQADFWFVADAELIIHGATEPGATVTIGGNPITLKSDGTFHLRIPFSEDLIDYMMTAIAANGQQSQTIHKQFSQEQSHST
ncbi:MULTISPECIES: DUF4912 domain-containing protein [unclassified Anabaena]|uniref:DUF4912 domain-containing protein n=1 Tax=unclassified Anabaena TaxID=2619674 RepID=UPI0039C66FDC